METFFISDTHFGHANIIKYTKRQFHSCAQMDEVMTEKWNSVVRPTDRVIHLGDFALGTIDKIAEYRKKLNGSIWLVIGNHDYSARRMAECGFNILLPKLGKYYTFQIGNKSVIVSHRPIDMKVWDEKELPLNKSGNTIRLCGHEHNNAPKFIRWCRKTNFKFLSGKIDDKAVPIQAMNMSVEHWSYTPMEYEKLALEYSKNV